MQTGTNPGGPGFIGGKVAQGANKKGDPIPNVNILLYTSNYVPVSYGVSDASGNFEIKNLAMGNYIVFPEIFGKSTIPYNVTLSTNNPSISNLITEIGSKEVVTGIFSEAQPESTPEILLYPNPVNDVLNMEIKNLSSSHSSIQIFDAMGRVVLTKNVELVTGNQEVNIPVGKLIPGIYYLRIADASGRMEQHYRFVKE